MEKFKKGQKSSKELCSQLFHRKIIIIKNEKIVISHLNDQPWNENKNQGKFRWKYMVDSTEMKSHGLSCGVLVLPPGEELPLHCHSPQEIYIIRQGEGLLLSSLNTKQVCKDSFVYIPKNSMHGLKNTGKHDLELLCFPHLSC